jgi:hypothetical protein
MRQAKALKPHVWLNVHSGMYALFTPYDHKPYVSGAGGWMTPGGARSRLCWRRGGDPASAIVLRMLAPSGLGWSQGLAADD